MILDRVASQRSSGASDISDPAKTAKSARSMALWSLYERPPVDAPAKRTPQTPLTYPAMAKVTKTNVTKINMSS